MTNSRTEGEDSTLFPLVSPAERRSSASYLAEKGDFDRCLLLFSGGLDTSVMLRWIADTYNCDVYTFTLNVGQQEDFAALESKAYQLGAKSISASMPVRSLSRIFAGKP